MSKKIVPLVHGAKTKYFKKPINIRAVVTGKALLPYQVPESIRITCKKKKICSNCYISVVGDILRFEKNDLNLIRFVNTSESHFATIIREILSVRVRCPIQLDVLSVYTVEEVYLSDVFDDKTKTTTSRLGYCINQSLECNVPYVLECYAIPEPKQQRVVHIITGAEQVKTNIDLFDLSKNEKQSLEIFNPLISTESKGAASEDEYERSVEAIYRHLEELYRIYALNTTKIYNRFDLHMAIDLVFHSPLQFNFNNEFIHKGYLDVLIIGDTRCGKGYVSENLIRRYCFGEIVSGENVSFAGLVGGLQQLSGRWVITWGKIPINNKRLVVIDEAGEMEPKDFSRLSRVRSEGIAEITKIQTEKAPAMTRLIFLANPKSRMIATYSFGIESIFDIIETTEDIARFDYVLIVAQNEVNINDINRVQPEVKDKFKQLDSLLVQWIWSRESNQIIFLPKSTALILRYAVALGNTYSPRIPLIQGENIRIKLAKISASIAGRLFSTDKKGENLIIRPEHVQAAYVFLNLIYKKSNSGYYTYSQIQKQSDDIFQKDEFDKYMHSFENKNDLVQYFVNNNYITVADLSECLNQPKEVAREVISKLIHHRCVQKRFTFYAKNACFTNWLRRM